MIDLNMKYGTNNLIILLKIQNIILFFFENYYEEFYRSDSEIVKQTNWFLLKTI